MTFASTLGTIQVRALTPAGRGVVTPLVRITTHLSAILEDLAAEIPFTDEDLTAELADIRAHADGILVDTQTVSTTARNTLSNLQQLVGDFISEFRGWDTQAKKNNTQEAINRIASVAAFLDNELAGLSYQVEQADAGTTI